MRATSIFALAAVIAVGKVAASSLPPQEPSGGVEAGDIAPGVKSALVKRQSMCEIFPLPILCPNK